MSQFTITPDASVGEIVIAHPFLSRQFELLGIDFCCGGKVGLETACRQKGLHVNSVIQSLESMQQSIEAEGSQRGDSSEQPSPVAPLSEWTNYIQSKHHSYLWQEMPQLLVLVQKVARVHGESDSRLVELASLFSSLVEDLSQHMHKEEEILFPWIGNLESSSKPIGETKNLTPCGSLENPIRQMLVEHENAGEILKQVRHLTEEFQVPERACNSYRAMLDRLHRLEIDLHLHVHLENNWVFPRAISLQNKVAL